MMYPVNQIGICDFDSYAILWYGNYWKYYRRMLLKHFGSAYTIEKMHQMLYVMPVQWKNRGSICVKVIEQKAGHYTVALFWYVDETIYNAMYVDIATKKEVDIETLTDVEQKMFRKLKIPFRLPKKNVAQFSQNATLYEDCMNGSYISERACLNLFEQTRTDSFGGQTNLSDLSSEYGYTIVVAKMYGLQFFRVPVRLGQPLVCQIALTRQIGNMCFEFHQQIVSNDKVLASAIIMLCIFDPKKKTLVDLPDAYLDRFSTTVEWL